jgi:hypothetical protein
MAYAGAAPAVIAETSFTPPSAGVSAPQTAPAPEVLGNGGTCIALATPITDMGSDFDPGADAGSGVRNTLAVALKTGSVETINLETPLAQQEAAQKGCGYVLHSKVTRKKGGGGMFGMMGPMLAGAAAGMIPGVGGIVASVATSTVITATTVSGGFKSKDEISFEYRLTDSKGTELIPLTKTKMKAKKNGDDVLTPQLQQAAEATLQKISQKPIS